MARRKRIAVLLPALALVAVTAEWTPAVPPAQSPSTAVAAAHGHPGPHGRPGRPSQPPTSEPSAPADPSEPPVDPSNPPLDPGDPSADPSNPPLDPGDPVPSPAPSQSPGDPADLEGPTPQDYVNIRQVGRTARAPRPGRNASRGTFTSRCGRNQNGHYNPDNFIVAPGVQNGAHHLHDYVGNLTADGFSTDQSLAAGGTTCQAGDRSSYYWPVLRLRAGQDTTPHAEQSRQDGNIGRVLVPASVNLQFRGNPRSRVVAMPRFIRVITGDAKAATNGPANARSQWTCGGFTNRVTTQYPLCPRGTQVMRVLDFPSCWDGRNLDSANHRTHIVFPDAATGACPAGTRAVPQLRMTIAYNVPARVGAFALDSFPEQRHNPGTDHGDFANVMPVGLMNRAVNCINSGRRC
ncbi:hypothetical protein DPM19_21705 [Actinomadura craniellae]|uniref:DUF1996 domain-containing protein n=1 Tax=Actinomadura craniellae TaxID=2231787 RepID=A0A365H1Y6_9ACTN|nr:DUF1996 domain-containing protein [Actinomadura craniellae]RAY13111.1 hypothetical protein DPM19_21705 [Actinomadura craniellae]